LRMVSFLGGRPRSTSLFTRRSRKGRSTCTGHRAGGAGTRERMQAGAALRNSTLQGFSEDQASSFDLPCRPG
jgi:hypothetical protein